jgi:hypothetical protein
MNRFSDITRLRTALGLQEGDEPRHANLLAHAADEIEALRTAIRGAHQDLEMTRIRFGPEYAFANYHVQQAWTKLDEALK